MWLTRSLAILLAFAAPSAIGDVLLIDGVEAAARTASERPTRGMTMARVESRFGAPITKEAPVGDPPITRWEYPDFIVYFEYEHVIHSVVRR
ncbi:MAG TPA: hypothetical protein VF339_01735 [Gammaproteobacteria bacterium]